MFFLESFGQKHGWALYMGAHYTQQNMVHKNKTKSKKPLPLRPTPPKKSQI